MRGRDNSSPSFCSTKTRTPTIHQLQFFTFCMRDILMSLKIKYLNNLISYSTITHFDNLIYSINYALYYVKIYIIFIYAQSSSSSSSTSSSTSLNSYFPFLKLLISSSSSPSHSVGKPKYNNFNYIIISIFKYDFFFYLTINPLPFVNIQKEHKLILLLINPEKLQLVTQQFYIKNLQFLKSFFLKQLLLLDIMLLKLKFLLLQLHLLPSPLDN